MGVPLLCMSARNDPIIHPSLLRHAEAAAATNPNVLLAVTQRGGHLGWLSGWGGHPWMMDVICEFAEAVINAKAAEKKLQEGAGVQKKQQQGVVGQVVLQAAGGGGDGVGKQGEGQGRAPSPGAKPAAVLVTAVDGVEGEAEGVAVVVGGQEGAAAGAAGGAAANGGGVQGTYLGTGEVALVVQHGAGQAGSAGGESGAEGGAVGGGGEGRAGDGVLEPAEVVLEVEGEVHGKGQGLGVQP